MEIREDKLVAAIANKIHPNSVVIEAQGKNGYALANSQDVWNGFQRMENSEHDTVVGNIININVDFNHDNALQTNANEYLCDTGGASWDLTLLVQGENMHLLIADDYNRRMLSEAYTAKILKAAMETAQIDGPITIAVNHKVGHPSLYDVNVTENNKIEVTESDITHLMAEAIAFSPEASSCEITVFARTTGPGREAYDYDKKELHDDIMGTLLANTEDCIERYGER